MDLTTTPPSPSTRSATPAVAAPAARMGPALQCPKCSAPTARDQRYCLECGQRLSEARPPFMREGGARALAATAVVAEAAPPRERAKLSQTALIAGVATLILAMGTGVLIGKNGNSSPTVQGIVAAPAAATTDTAATTPTDSASTSEASEAASKSTSSDAKAKKAAAEAKAAGADVITSDSKKTGKKVTYGSKGSGKGYEDGEFTGNFFGN